jgi:AraC-like DNA-binding protein
MRYAEQRAAAGLAQHLECFWFVSDSDGSAVGGQVERVLPDGCMEWIFHLGAPFQRATLSGEWERQPRSFVVGELTRFLLLQPTGRIEIMGVRFKPGGAYRFLPFPLDRFTDNTIPTADVWGRDGTDLEEAVFEATSDRQRQKLVEEFLLAKLETTAPRPRLEAAIEEITRSRGQTRVHDLAGRIGLSPRQLEREFRSGVGVSPKALARIVRFQNLLRLVGEGPLRKWAWLALEGGYADQPHMVREFREFAGQSPSERQVTAAGELASCFISPRRLAALLGPSERQVKFN